ncbi:MAG TPA: hypothetical protein H9685_08595 [Firmicutes bacterium]|nr:hypothetical protein [Bacillota bacterium]
MKKFFSSISLILVFILTLIPVNAADYPAYLHDGIDEYFEVQTRGNYIPSSSNVLYLPGQSGSFSYSFANRNIQYSDFVISPQNTTTGIRMSYRATSSTHTATLKVIRKDTGTVIHSETITALNGFTQEFYLSFTYLEQNRGYYIELSNPSISNASGICTVN